MSATITEETFGSFKKIKYEWATASSSSGGTTGVTTKAYNGKIERLITIPGASAAAPAASYDITVTDEESIDVLAGGGANRGNSATEQVASSLGTVVNDKLTLNVTNAGSSHSGVAIIYLR